MITNKDADLLHAYSSNQQVPAKSTYLKLALMHGVNLIRHCIDVIHVRPFLMMEMQQSKVFK